MSESGGPDGVEKVEHEEKEREARMAEDGDFTSETEQTTVFQAASIAEQKADESSLGLQLTSKDMATAFAGHHLAASNAMTSAMALTLTGEEAQEAAEKAKVEKAATKHDRDKRGARLKAAKGTEGTAKEHAKSEQATADWEAAKAVTKSAKGGNAYAEAAKEAAKAAAKADEKARKIVIELLATSGVRDAVVNVDLGKLKKEENDAKGIFPKSLEQVSR